MAAVDDPRTLGRTRLSFANAGEIDEFVDVLGQFERGDITADEWRQFRLVRGTYGQRQTDDAQMLRVKIPQGIVSADQLEAFAEVSERYSRGFCHITTRQNIQYHFVPLRDIEHAMRRLADAGLTTREACGNSVRTITACPFAGVAADEAFDVTPYAEALTRYLLRHPLSSTLPRKFKIAFEGCPDDHALTAINDIGYCARVEPAAGGVERRGFRVTIGGGTATMSRAGEVLYDFAPAGEILDIAEAVVRVFHRLGDYKHKARNRMKFLIRQLGWERWRAEFESEFAVVRAEGGAPLPFDPDAPPVEQAPAWPRPRPQDALQIAARVAARPTTGPGLHPQVTPRLRVSTHAYEQWLATNVRAQKQPGYALAIATLPLGDITGAQLRIVADLARAYGDGSVRVTPEQDLVFRWVPLADIGALYERLAAAGLGRADACTIADVTSCPGAESCRLAVTQSRGLGRLLDEYLQARPALVRAAEDASIKISGCPNGCGQHHIAAIGFQGSVRKLGDRAVPQYFVMVGGGVRNGTGQFARLAAKVPARRAGETLERLVTLYQSERAAGEDATGFFQRVEVARVKAALADLETLTLAHAQPEDFIDLGEAAEFKPEVMDGECSA